MALSQSERLPRTDNNQLLFLTASALRKCVTTAYRLYSVLHVSGATGRLRKRKSTPGCGLQTMWSSPLRHKGLCP